MGFPGSLLQHRGLSRFFFLDIPGFSRSKFAVPAAPQVFARCFFRAPFPPKSEFWGRSRDFGGRRGRRMEQIPGLILGSVGSSPPLLDFFFFLFFPDFFPFFRGFYGSALLSVSFSHPPGPSLPFPFPSQNSDFKKIKKIK